MTGLGPHYVANMCIFGGIGTELLIDFLLKFLITGDSGTGKYVLSLIPICKKGNRQTHHKHRVDRTYKSGRPNATKTSS